LGIRSAHHDARQLNADRVGTDAARSCWQGNDVGGSRTRESVLGGGLVEEIRKLALGAAWDFHYREQGVPAWQDVARRRAAA
jgi:hypothetical protein